MRVLVTGHGGYIGSALVPILRSRGHDVVGMDSGLYDGCDLGRPPATIPVIVRDVRDVTDEDLSGIEALIHLAGICNDPLGDLDPQITNMVNWAGTLRLARAAQRAEVGRFVFSSTCSVYGWADPGRPVDEGSECRPLTVYAASKLRAEVDLVRLASDRFSPVILRSGSLYGPSPRFRSDLVVNGLTAAAYTARRLELQTDGTPWRPLVALDDVVGVMARVLEAPQETVHAQTFNVGSDELNVQVSDIAGMVADELPGTTVRLAAGAGPDERSYRASFGKLAATFPDLRMQTDLRAGVRALVTAFDEAGLTDAELEKGRYARLQTIQQRLAGGELDAELRPVGIGQAAVVQA
jgi:nucleoside-diphosphate-sugar epimerase